jgi:hypothetical protein
LLLVQQKGSFILFEEAKPLLAADSGPEVSGDSGAANGELDFGWRKKGNVGTGCQNFFQVISCKDVSVTAELISTKHLPDMGLAMGADQ